MIPIHVGRNGRWYRYYVCRNARETKATHGPSRSLGAHGIEQAVLDRLVQSEQMSSEELPIGLRDRIELLRRHIERVGYNGASGRVSVRFREH